jgi:SAM-dependent methyltransferase
MDEKSFTTIIGKSSADVLAFYDQYAGSWDRRFGDVPSVQDFHMDRLRHFLDIARLNSTETAVEVGVGTGPYLEEIAPLVKQLICVDGSMEMLRVLQEKHGHLDTISVRQMDLDWPVKGMDIQADIVYSFGLIEHILNPDQLIENCARMLRIGGRMVFASSNGRCPWYGSLRYLFRPGKHISTDRHYHLSELNMLMARYGFVPERVIYWGYYPPGVGRLLQHAMQLIGKLIDLTPLRVYAGGYTVSYLPQR